MAAFKSLIGEVIKQKSRTDDAGFKRQNTSSPMDLKKSNFGKMVMMMTTKSKLEAASIAASASADTKRAKLIIWPEWSDADVNAEKWDMAHKGKEKDKGKSPVVQHLFDDPEGKIEMPQTVKVDHWKRPQDYITEKTPTVIDQDAMGSFDLITNNEHLHESELMRNIISQIMAVWEMSSVKNPPADQMTGDPSIPYEEVTHSWRPWEHIYALTKVQKGPHIPPFNPYGKYVVRLYWMGCWRKIIVDDTLPFDENERLMLPSTTLQHEVWPMLLTKALIKVASLDYTGGSQSCEFGDFSVVNCLTGWLPEAIPLHGFLREPSFAEPDSSDPSVKPGSGRVARLVTTSQVLDKYFTLSKQAGKEKAEANPSDPQPDVRYGHISEVWELLKGQLPEWKLPLQEWEIQLEAEEKAKREELAAAEGLKEEKSEKDSASKDGKVEKQDAKPAGKDGKDKPKDAKEKEKGGKDSKDKKDKDKDKKGDNPKRGASRLSNRTDATFAKKKSLAKMSNKLQYTIMEGAESDEDVEEEKTSVEETPIPDHPEVVIFASYRSTPKYPVKVSVLGENADASERLRQNGLSHLYPHPVLITQTRSCPLEPPPPPEKIPAWKLIRPKKKKVTPSDEPVAEPEPPKPIRCLEITSPFVNYKVSPVPIPTDTHRPKSALERGGTRSRPQSVNGAIEERDDENAPSPEPEEAKEPEKMETEEPAEVVPEEKPAEAPVKPCKEKSGRKQSVTNRKEAQGSGQEISPKPERRGSSKTGGVTRTKSGSRAGSREGVREVKKEEVKEVKEKEVKNPPHVPRSQASTPMEASGDAGGLAPPPVETEDGSLLEVEQLPEVEDTPEDAPKAKKLWMDFDQFCKCFKTLYIFHKPNTYLCSAKHSDLKSVAPSALPPAKGDKKSAPNTAGVNQTPSKIFQTPSHLSSAIMTPLTNSSLNPNVMGSAPPQGYEDKAPHYLFVDSLQPTEIVVSYSVLSRWPEPPAPPVEEKKSHTSVKGGKDKVEDKELTTFTSSSVMEGSLGKDPPPTPVTPGTLVAEPYSWKSLVTGQPILRLRTSAIRAAVLSLPAGRHVLKFMMSAPLGYHAHLCSSTPFVFGDEETVMAQLTKESCRFVDNANQVINGIGNCIGKFNDADGFNQAWKDLVNCHCPYQLDKQMSKQQHFQVFNDSLYTMLRKVLREIASPEIAFAWRVFTFDAVTKNILSLPSGSRPATGQTSHRGSAKHPPAQANAKGKQPAPPVAVEGEPEKTDHGWSNRKATNEEQVASVKVQRNWKGFWVRKMKLARNPGSEDNLKVMQNLQKSWALIEPQLDPSNPDHPGLFLFRHMFKKEPDLMQKYPFYQDEWNKISYNDYLGQYPDQPPNTWFVVFRDVFHVVEEMLVVPKLYVPINTCMLRVINNDTGEEIPRIFQRVAPYIYKKNRKGYTFVAEARTLEQPLQTGRWKMRLIGSLSPLPAPIKNEVNSSFTVKEIRDYYLPNLKNVVFRYAVKVTEDHLTSIQMNTSKSDVYIKLVVLNNEEEVASTIGKGHAVIPAFTFRKDINPDEELKRSNSRSSNKMDKPVEKGKKGKRGGSGRSNDGRGSPHAKGRRRKTSSAQDHSDGGLSDIDVDEKDLKPHKYIVEALVLRDSWPLSEASWAFVQMLKDLEKNELKVAFKEKVVEEPPKAEKTTAAADKTKGKGGKGGKAGKDKDSKGSRPPSQQFDIGKPHWTLRIVSDASAAEDIEVKKDTERADEIRALKKAWEDADPGRAAKAMQSRLKYLSTHTIKLVDDEEGKEEGEKTETDVLDLPTDATPQTPGSFLDTLDDSTLTLEPPPPPTPKEMLQPLDVTPFVRKAAGPPRYLDEEEEERKLEEQKRQITEYKQFRQQVEQWREQDKQLRNMTKEKQLQECEELQAMLDSAREAVNKPREAFRQKYLEAERKRQEALQAQEAQLKADLEAKSPKGKKNSAKGKKSPAGKRKK